MAKIFLNIEAEDAADLQRTLTELANVTTVKVDYRMALAEQVQEREELPDARSTQDAEPGEQPKRTHRTKAKMEAARAAEAGQASSGSATAASTASQAASASDPFMEQVKQAAAETAASDQQPTMEAVRKAMSAYLQVDGHNAGTLQKILKEHGAGAERASEVPAEKYAAVIAALVAES